MAISRAIQYEETVLKNKYSILNHQNTLGFIIFTLTLLSFITVSSLFYLEMLPAWFCIISIAFITSIAHELEHDLIHHLYYKRTPLLQNFMMFVVWLIRPNTVNPWYRRKIHFNHHKTSGTSQDTEERLVGNGEKNLLMRLIVVSDGLFGLALRRNIFNKEISGFKFFTVINAGFPLATCYFILLYAFIIFHGVNALFPSIFIPYQSSLSTPLISQLLYWCNFIIVILVLPNFIRSACLNLVTSSMHYYGGVTHLLQQTQVLNHWYFIPFQWFCFNFGHTHSIHHFVPNQPFYVRQLISKKVYGVMKENGVRFNDLSTVLNGNYYQKKRVLAT